MGEDVGVSAFDQEEPTRNWRRRALHGLPHIRQLAGQYLGGRVSALVAERAEIRSEQNQAVAGAKLADVINTQLPALANADLAGP